MNNKIIVKDCYAVKDGLFKNNNQLSEVVIGEGVISIGNEAFAGCENLKRVFIPESIKLISTSAFSGSGVLLKIPNESKNGYISSRTIMIFCKENSYADIWFKKKKAGYIVVNS